MSCYTDNIIIITMTTTSSISSRGEGGSSKLSTSQHSTLVLMTITVTGNVLYPTTKSVGTHLYPHMPILRPHAVQYSTSGSIYSSVHALANSSAALTSVDLGLQARLLPVVFIVQCNCWLIRQPILGFWGAKFTEMGDCRPKMPINHCAKFDLTPLALSLANKSVTIETKKKHKQ